MENFELILPARGPFPVAALPTLRGVVASGNLEVLLEPGQTPDRCAITVNTSAHGFRTIWEAVLQDFAERHPVGGLRLSINDAGATPAVVSLRLDQAFDACRSAWS